MKLTNQHGPDVSEGIKGGAGAWFAHSFTMANYCENFVSELSEWARQNPKLAKGLDETGSSLKSEKELKKAETPKKASEMELKKGRRQRK